MDFSHLFTLEVFYSPDIKQTHAQTKEIETSCKNSLPSNVLLQTGQMCTCRNGTLFCHFTFAHIFYRKKLNAKVNKRILITELVYAYDSCGKESTSSGCDSIGLFTDEF